MTTLYELKFLKCLDNDQIDEVHCEETSCMVCTRIELSSKEMKNRRIKGWNSNDNC